MPDNRAQERLAAQLAEKLSQDLPTGDSPGDLAEEAAVLAGEAAEAAERGNLWAAVACTARAGNLARAVVNAPMVTARETRVALNAVIHAAEAARRAT